MKDTNEFDRFLSTLLRHSVEHFILTSAMIVLGVDDKDIRSHNSREGNQIYLYDNLTDGNGCAETLQRFIKVPPKMRVEAIRNAIEKDTPVTLPSKDFYSVLEEFMSGCKAERADSVYLKLLTDQSTTKLVEASSADDSVRQQLLTNLRDNSLLDEYTLSHLDALLRYQSHYLVLRKTKTEQLFLYKLVPEALVLGLSDQEKSQLSPEIEADRNRAALGKVQDALEMCIDGCPVCLYTRYCESSIFLMRFSLSRRLVERAYRIVKNKSTSDIGKAQRDEALLKALDLLKRNDFVYLRADPVELQTLLETVFALLGQPIKESKVVASNFSFDYMRDGYVVKLEVEK
jgi:hypothetical protein